jgi:hypothetical protein
MPPSQGQEKKIEGPTKVLLKSAVLLNLQIHRKINNLPFISGYQLRFMSGSVYQPFASKKTEELQIGLLDLGREHAACHGLTVKAYFKLNLRA